MPTIEWNLDVWNSGYDWARSGEEWSSSWGSADMQWNGSILPRIHSFLPAATILEIAPGYGRWTRYLQPLCERLVIVDLSQRCIDHCRRRFSWADNIEYHVNDGLSLEMVRDNSIDFVFSFDSLVHAEKDVIDGYLKQLRRKMRRNGVGFIHHSNLGAYRRFFVTTSKLKNVVRNRVRENPRLDQQGNGGSEVNEPSAKPASPLRRISIAARRLGIDHDHGRALSMSAEIFERSAREGGLDCIAQEKVNWESVRLIDCISLFVARDGDHPRENLVMENRFFMEEARRLSCVDALYGRQRFGPTHSATER